MIRSRLLVASVLVAVLAAPGLAQRTLTVPTQFATITAAMTAANSGDTIVVAPGIYAEAVSFRGKNVLLESSDGPERTIIRGTVDFSRGETSDAILDGFTVTGPGRGVKILNAAPIVRNNIIRDNSLDARRDGPAQGAGIYAAGGSVWPLILSNRIFDNTLTGSWSLATPYPALGAGVYSVHAVVAGNVIERNTIYSVLNFSTGLRILGGGIYARESVLVNNIVSSNAVRAARGVSPDGGGIYAIDSDVIHNTVVNNQLWSVWQYPTACGGVSMPISGRLINSIVRGNGTCEVAVRELVSHCNITGGHAGPGNIDAPAGFIAVDDFHLRFDSANRGAGANGYLNFAANDLDWNDRGHGGGVDIGADEFAPHVHHAGKASRGTTVSVRVTGDPGEVVVLGWAAQRVTPPIPVLGTLPLHLDPTTLRVMSLGRVPAPQGYVELALAIPATAPLGTIPVQALVGPDLTRLLEIDVVP